MSVFGVEGLVEKHDTAMTDDLTHRCRSFRLAFCAALSHIRSPQVTRSVGIPSTLQFGLVCFYSFRVSVYICLVPGAESESRTVLPLLTGQHDGLRPLFRARLAKGERRLEHEHSNRRSEHDQCGKAHNRSA